MPYARRGRQADEILRVFKTLWTDERPSFDGEFFKVRDLGFAPKPVQKPHPPIWVGGRTAAAFRRVATLGDGWHATSHTPKELREDLLPKLRIAADAAKRDFKTIDLSLRFTVTDAMLAEGSQVLIDRLGEYKRLGFTHVLVEFRREDLTRMLEILDLVAGTVKPAVDAA